MHVVKGMVQVGGTTYRIERLSPGQYRVVRISDDAQVGTFESQPRLHVTSSTIEPTLLHQVALMAIKGAKTTWVGRLPIPK